jgi:hypothetical protein
MLTTGLKQATHLTYYSRSAQRRPIVINASSELLPRETFLGHPELLAFYDEFLTLKERTIHYNRQARTKAAEAEVARGVYKAAKAAALGSGGDPELIEDTSEALDKQADEYRGYARDATSQATRVGTALGPLMAAAAPHLFAPSEAVMDDAATQVRGSLADLKKTWAVWSTSWAIRRKLSEMHLLGGQQYGISEGAALPLEVTQALSVLEDHLRNIDRLQADEIELEDWRADQATALKTQAAAMAKPATRPHGNLYSR